MSAFRGSWWVAFGSLFSVGNVALRSERLIQARVVKLKDRPSAVIFDLDGVLLDTEPLYTQAITGLLAEFGKSYSWDLKSRSMGTAARKSAQLVIDELALSISVDEWLERRKGYLEPLFQRAPALPGAQEFVASLRENRIPSAVATSSERRLCELKWSTHPWLRAFDVVICGDDPGIENLKPAPDIYLEAARRLGRAPEECLVFEDSPAGVKSGKAAGMQVVCIKAEELDRSMVEVADLVVAGYAELSLSDVGLERAF